MCSNLLGRQVDLYGGCLFLSLAPVVFESRKEKKKGKRGKDSRSLSHKRQEPALLSMLVIERRLTSRTTKPAIRPDCQNTFAVLRIDCSRFTTMSCLSRCTRRCRRCLEHRENVPLSASADSFRSLKVCCMCVYVCVCPAILCQRRLLPNRRHKF